MNVRYQDKVLLDSRTFTTFGLGETEVDITDGKESLNLILDFQENPSEKQGLNFNALNTQTGKLTLINFGKPFGAGFKEPINIGTLSHKLLYLLLHVVPVGADPTCKTVHLSVYLGKEVRDGQN